MHMARLGIMHKCRLFSEGGRDLSCAAVFVLAALLAAQHALGQAPPRRTTQRVARTDDDFERFQQFLLESERDLGGYRRGRIDLQTDGSFEPSRVDMRQVRRVLNAYATDAKRLMELLSAESGRNSDLRFFRIGIAKLRARTGSLADFASSTNDVRRIAADYQGIDREWRTIAHQLGRLNGLSRILQSAIERTNGHNRQLGNLFQLRPQLSHRELASQAAALRSGLNNLLDDIDMEPGSRANQYLSPVRKLLQQANYVENVIVNRYERDVIVREYKRFRQPWYELARDLRTLDSSYVERSVRRVARAENSLGELLWLPKEADRSHLLHLAQSLMRDVDEFFGRTPLRMLLQLPDSSYALHISGEFYGVCENFEDCVERKESDLDLQECYTYVVEAAEGFLRSFDSIHSQTAKRVLNDIEDSLVALADEMDYAGDGQQDALELAARLESLAEHVDDDIRRWLNADRPSFESELLAVSQHFVGGCRDLRVALEHNSPDDDVLDQSSALNKEWQAIYFKYLRNARDSEKIHFVELSRQIFEGLYDLGTLFEAT